MKYLANDPSLKRRRSLLRKNQTDAEKFLWQRLRNRQLHGIKFYRQYSIGSFILDFYSPKQKLAIEIDGGQHNEQSSREKDTQRSEFLSRNGIKVVRFWNNDVLRNSEGVLEELSKHVTPPNLPLS